MKTYPTITNPHFIMLYDAYDVPGISCRLLLLAVQQAFCRHILKGFLSTYLKRHFAYACKQFTLVYDQFTGKPATSY